MDVKEGPSGAYVGKFKEFIKAGKKKTSYIHDTAQGPIVRYRVVSDKTATHAGGLDLPGSFSWDWSHYSIEGTLGAFGLPARALKSAAKGINPNAFLKRLESKLEGIGAVVSVWLPDTGSGAGWIKAIKPNEGTFQVEFEKFLTRDDDDLPIHIRSTGTRQGKNGPYTFDEDTFNALLKVTSGNHEGATFIYRVHYMIEQDLPGHFLLNLKGTRGKAFYDLFNFHGVDLKMFDPQKKCHDSDNILPESEVLFLKAGTPLMVEVTNGWVDKVIRSPAVGKVESVLLSAVTRKPRAKKKVAPETSAYLGTLKLIINKETGRKYFDVDGDMLAPVKAWKKFVAKHKLPAKPIDRYTTPEVKEALILLGYDQIANALSKE